MGDDTKIKTNCQIWQTIEQVRQRLDRHKCGWDGVEIQLLGFCLQERLVLGRFPGLFGGFFAGTFGQNLSTNPDMLIQSQSGFYNPVLCLFVIFIKIID